MYGVWVGGSGGGECGLSFGVPGVYQPVLVIFSASGHFTREGLHHPLRYTRCSVTVA